jgi:hypothetical protein
MNVYTNKFGFIHYCFAMNMLIKKIKKKCLKMSENAYRFVFKQQDCCYDNGFHIHRHHCIATCHKGHHL